MIDSVGIIGSSALGQAVARLAAAAGVSTLLANSRGPASLIEVVARLGDSVQAVSVAEAARAQLIVVAIPFVRVPELVGQIVDWTGRVAVDATNQFAHYRPTYSAFIDLCQGPAANGSPGNCLEPSSSTRSTQCLPSTSTSIPAAPTAGRWCSTPPMTMRPTPTSPIFWTASDSPPFTSDFCAKGGRLMHLGGLLSALHVRKRD